MMNEELLDKKTTFVDIFSKFYKWFEAFINFPHLLMEPNKKVFDYLDILNIHINDEGERCSVVFYTYDCRYFITIMTPSNNEPLGYMFGTISPRIEEEGTDILPANDLRDGAYTESTWKRIVDHIISIEGQYPELLELKRKK